MNYPTSFFPRACICFLRLCNRCDGLSNTVLKRIIKIYLHIFQTSTKHLALIYSCSTVITIVGTFLLFAVMIYLVHYISILIFHRTVAILFKDLLQRLKYKCKINIFYWLKFCRSRSECGLNLVNRLFLVL